MSQPLLRLVGLWQEFQQANISVKRLGDILDIPQEPHSLTPMREGGGQGHLALNDIAFRYSEHLPWLYQHLNIAFAPGKLTVLMGPSGCGKSGSMPFPVEIDSTTNMTVAPVFAGDRRHHGVLR